MGFSKVEVANYLKRNPSTISNSVKVIKGLLDVNFDDAVKEVGNLKRIFGIMDKDAVIEELTKQNEALKKEISELKELFNSIKTRNSELNNQYYL